MGQDIDGRSIGDRARAIRRRRGLSLDAAAGLAGISESYLSRLERGERQFDRRSLIENLAEALGCSPRDLTGGPALGTDARALSAASAVPALGVALHDTTFDDVPDIPHRPLRELVEVAAQANAAADEVRYPLSSDQLGNLITELHVVIATAKDTDQVQVALAALVEACIVARSLAGTLGHGDLAVAATHRGWEAARRAERPDLVGLMAMGRAISLNRIGARRRAGSILSATLADLAPLPGPTDDDTATAQARGMLHLAAAHLAARNGDIPTADTHLSEASDLARHTGERNHMRYHFGPANVATWRLAVAVETERGPDEVTRLTDTPIDTSVLGSADRVAALHFDLARAHAQAGGDQDTEAVRHIDTADRVAPLRIRQDPLTRELIGTLDRRARRRVWELDSMKRRVGIA